MTDQMHIPLKVAMVKSSVYQDLWICDRSKDMTEIFKTTIMRTSPIGLLEAFNTEFLIVKDCNEYPCTVNKACLPRDWYDKMKYAKEGKSPGGFLDETYHKHITVDSVAYDVDSVDWSQYQIVITMNGCIPERVITKYPNILWCYYIGENEECLIYNKFSCYDIVLNQDVTKPGLPPWMIGMPYSYLGPYTIPKVIKSLFPNKTSEKHGVFMEINNTEDRPVTTIPSIFLKIQEETSIPILIHSQNIVENISRISNAKYFVKLLGRPIRGNGILEVISAGTLVLANRGLVMLRELVLEECHVETEDDVITKIRWFESHPTEYAAAVEKQRTILYELFYKGPAEKLAMRFWEKRGMMQSS